MTSQDALQEDVRRLHDHLVAVQELPVERTASRWIGEAEAVAADLVDADVGDDVLRNRLSHVRELLDNVADPGDPTAEERVADAERITVDLLDRLDED